MASLLNKCTWLVGMCEHCCSRRTIAVKGQMFFYMLWKVIILEFAAQYEATRANLWVQDIHQNKWHPIHIALK